MKPFLYLLLFDIVCIIMIFMIATLQQSGGVDVEFIINGIEYLIKSHLLISIFLLIIRFNWAKKNSFFIIVCMIVGIIPFLLQWIHK